MAFSVEATKEFAKQVAQDSTLKIWQDLYHELHNEPQKEEIMKYLIKWLKSQTSAS